MIERPIAAAELWRSRDRVVNEIDGMRDSIMEG